MTSRELADGRRIRVPDVARAGSVGTLAAELEVDGATVEGGDYGGLVAEGNIAGSVLRDVDLSGAKIGPVTLVDVVGRNVDLSNASLQQVVARRLELTDCRAIGVRLSFDHASDVSIVDCRLDYATIHVETVKGVAVFSGCSFREATISGDLSNTVFQDCDFVGTEFRVRRAAKCELRTSRLAEARGLLTLKGATISMEQAVAMSAVIAAEAGLIVSG
jgi:uncharacterized protein YjbI with pentapeptide repeats